MGVDYTSGHGYGIAIPEPDTHEDSINAALNTLFPEKHHIPFDGTIHEAIEKLWEELLQLGVFPMVQGNYWSGEGMHLIFFLDGTQVDYAEHEGMLHSITNLQIPRGTKTEGLRELMKALDKGRVSYHVPNWMVYRSVM